MNEIWHIEGEPNLSTLVVVIDKKNKIIDFVFYCRDS